jgi:hypothetical protein
MNEYKFLVDATLVYNIEADNEKNARKILVEKGGLDIKYSDILIEKKDYEDANLEDEEVA